MLFRLSIARCERGVTPETKSLSTYSDSTSGFLARGALAAVSFPARCGDYRPSPGVHAPGPGFLVGYAPD